MKQAIKTVLRRTGITGRIQGMWQREIDRSARDVHRDTARLTKKLERMLERARTSLSDQASRLRSVEKRLPPLDRTVHRTESRLEAIEARLAKFELANSIDCAQSELIEDLSRQFDRDAVRSHVARAVQQASLREAPCAHLVIEQLFPPAFYDLVLASLPPVPFFRSRDSVKMNLNGWESGVLPYLTRVIWKFIDRDLSHGMADVVLRRLWPFIRARYRELFGEAWADAALSLPHEPSGGRLMLRRPGYCLRPHLDPKRTSATVLIYCAKPGDPETVGTDLYALSQAVRPIRTSTYYPEDHGVECSLAERIPFRANSALVFVNSGAAHAAEIPVDTQQKDLLRYAFQFYIGPEIPELLQFVSRLPLADQQPWLGLAAKADGQSTM